MKSAVIKRSVTLNGHKTSVSLENEFWDALREIAERANLPLPRLMEQVDKDRTTCNLSSAIRIFVFNHFRAQNPIRDFQATGASPRKHWFLISDGHDQKADQRELTV
jgi:predicted DNA-binding ribbon-helix-helix protein